MRNKKNIFKMTKEIELLYNSFQWECILCYSEMLHFWFAIKKTQKTLKCNKSYIYLLRISSINKYTPSSLFLNKKLIFFETKDISGGTLYILNKFINKSLQYWNSLAKKYECSVGGS